MLLWLWWSPWGVCPRLYTAEYGLNNLLGLAGQDWLGTLIVPVGEEGEGGEAA